MRDTEFLNRINSRMRTRQSTKPNLEFAKPAHNRPIL